MPLSEQQHLFTVSSLHDFIGIYHTSSSVSPFQVESYLLLYKFPPSVLYSSSTCTVNNLANFLLCPPPFLKGSLINRPNVTGLSRTPQ